MTAPSNDAPQPDAPQRNVTEVPPARGRFAKLYGAKPWHLVSLLLCFLVTGYAVTRLLGDLPALLRIAIWFVGSAVVWDLLLGPTIALADTLVRPVLRRVQVRRVSPLNYVRFPALLSALLLLVFAPLILQRSELVYAYKSGLTQDPYLDRWLLVTALLFLASAVAYAVAVARDRRRG